MRSILRAYRNNPIEKDPASEMVEYAKKHGGFIRVTYRDADGNEKKVLLRPEAVVARGDALLLEGTDPRTLETLPVATIRSMKQTIGLKDIDTMAYRAEKDVDAILSSEGGAFRFLGMDFPFSFEAGGRKYNSIHTAVVGQFAGPETQKAIKKANSYDVPLVDLSDRWVNEKGEITEFAQKFVADALRTKFSQSQFQRWLTATGTRPFALPEYFGIDINATLEELRAEALKGGVAPSAPPAPKPALERTAVLGAAPTAAAVKEAEGYLRTLAQQRLAYSQSLRGPDAPEIVALDPYELRFEGEKPVDAIVYIRALGRQATDKIPDTILAVTKPAIPYIVLDEPVNVEDDRPARRAIKWLLEHPLWNRIGLAVASRSPNSGMIAAQTLDYLAMTEAALQDPDLRAEVSREVSLRFDDAGNIISPIGGKVAGILKGARGYKIALEDQVNLTRESMRKASLTIRTISELATSMRDVAGDLEGDERLLRLLERADQEALAPIVEEAERRAKADNRPVIPAVQEAKKRASAENIGVVGFLSNTARALMEDVRNLAAEVNDALNAASSRQTEQQREYDPIRAAKTDRAELENAMRFANIAATIVGKYQQLAIRVVTSAEALARHLKRKDLRGIADRFRDKLGSPVAGVSARYKGLKELMDKIQEQIRSIPRELMSDSRSDNLKGLQKYYPYPGYEVEYFYSGPKLYRYVYLELPIGMEPVNIKKNDVLTTGSVIEVAGARRDIPTPRQERFSIDSAIVIAQDFAINCAPVSVEVIDLSDEKNQPITNRQELVLTINGLLEKKAMNLRRQAAEAKVLESDDKKATDALAEIYKKLGPNNFMDNCARDPKFVEDPVFYVLLTGPSGTYLVADGGIAPRELTARLSFLEEMDKKYGPSAVVYYDADTRRIMSDIPLDAGKIPLIKQLTGYQDMTIRQTILAGAVGDGFFEYSPARAFSGKGLSQTKQEARKQLREKEVAGRFFATGVSGASGAGPAGKVFIGKTDKPREVAPVAGGLGTAGRMEAGSYDPGTGGVMTLVAGSRGSKDKEVQTAYVVSGKDRWGRYMDQLDELRKVIAKTPKERALEKAREKREAEAEEAGETARPAATQTARPAVTTDDDPFGIFKNPLLRYRRNTNGEPPEPPRRRRVVPGASAVGADQIRTPEVAPAAAPAAAAAEAAASPFSAIPAAAPEAGKVPSEDAALALLRKKAADTWRAFVTDLRKHSERSGEGSEKGTRKVALKTLLEAYTQALGALETALDARDREILKQPNGELRLRELLRAEAEASMDIARAAYTRASRGDKTQPTQTQLEKVASWAAQSLDAFGRPLAPPSISEMAAAGLPPLNISSARIADTRLTPAARARALPAAMSFSDLKKAAEIAAKAAKRDDKGISTSAVACRVMKPERMVAFKLAAEPFHQMLFRQFGARKEVGKFRTILMWFSPDSAHIIFYVNGVATCEFHADGALPAQDQFPQLLGDVLKYTEDWFNDPREGERRKDYRVLMGKSGCIRLYQIWGATPQPSAALRKSRGPFVAQVAFETMVNAGLLGGEKDELGLYCPEKAPGVARVWADKGVAERYRTTPEEMVAAEKAAYTKALSEAGYGARAPWARSYALAIEGPSAFTKAMSTQAANEVEAALRTPSNHVTLFYPAMYSEDGNLDRGDLSLTTGEELRVHLDRIVSAATSGAVFNVIDASLFSESVFLNAISTFVDFDPDEYFRPPNPLEVREGIKQRVVPPAFYLFQMLLAAGKKDITIKLITRLPYATQNSESFQSLQASFSDPSIPVRLVFVAASEGGAFMSLKQDFEHGSRLILWNTPDMPNADAFFGRRNGIREVAEIAASNFGLIRDIMVESSGYERKEKKTLEQETASGAVEEVVRPFIFSLPELLRKDMVDILRRTIIAGRRAGRDYASILGVPERIGKEIEKVAEDAKAQATAEKAIDIMAAAYGGKGTQFVRYGPRFIPERENRGKPPHRRR